jgi:hypothetical protein
MSIGHQQCAGEKAVRCICSQYDPYWEFEDIVASKLVSYNDRPKIERHDVSRSILKSLISMKLGLGLMLESDVGVHVPSSIQRIARWQGSHTRGIFAVLARNQRESSVSSISRAPKGALSYLS